jgi:hypothetical protein
MQIHRNKEELSEMREAKTWILIVLQICSKGLVYFDSEKATVSLQASTGKPVFPNQIILIYYHLTAA